MIWEILLANMDEDLVVVTGDYSFLENQRLLKAEYTSVTGRKLILVTESLGAALKAVGLTPSQKLLDAEKELPDNPFPWIAKGAGRHAAILFEKIQDLIAEYVDEIDEDIGGDQAIIPIKRLIAARMSAYVEEIEMDIRREFGTDGESDVSPPGEP